MPVETYVNTGAAEAPVQVDGVGTAVEITAAAIPIMQSVHAYQQALGEQHAGAQPTPEVGPAELSPDGDQQGFIRQQRFPSSGYKSRAGAWGTA